WPLSSTLYPRPTRNSLMMSVLAAIRISLPRVRSRRPHQAHRSSVRYRQGQACRPSGFRIGTCHESPDEAASPRRQAASATACRWALRVGWRARCEEKTADVLLDHLERDVDHRAHIDVFEHERAAARRQHLRPAIALLTLDHAEAGEQDVVAVRVRHVRQGVRHRLEEIGEVLPLLGLRLDGIRCSTFRRWGGIALQGGADTTDERRQAAGNVELLERIQLAALVLLAIDLELHGRPQYVPSTES